MHALKRSREAELDIAGAAQWYEEKRPGLGIEFVDELEAAAALLKTNPLRCPVRFGQIRRFNLKRFPYSIFFYLSQELIVVLGVLHIHRDSRKILKRRDDRPSTN